jgi:hypothetical protein
MNSNELFLQWFAPQPPPELEVITLHALAYEFRHEVQQRQAFADYCAWYAAIAQEHRADLEKMRRETNFLRFFGQRY